MSSLETDEPVLRLLSPRIPACGLLPEVWAPLGLGQLLYLLICSLRGVFIIVPLGMSAVGLQEENTGPTRGFLLELPGDPSFECSVTVGRSHDPILASLGSELKTSLPPFSCLGQNAALRVLCAWPLWILTDRWTGGLRVRCLGRACQTRDTAETLGPSCSWLGKFRPLSPSG